MVEKKNRQKMNERSNSERIKDFQEVPLGYTVDQAISEARRCIQCKNPQCVKGCPVEIDIPGFLRFIVQGNFEAAVKKIKETNALPAVCGRVCPQEEQCELKCILGVKGESVGIGNLERFVADWERENVKAKQISLSKGAKDEIAVVGSGPAGLTCAGDLARLGYKVTIFESLHVTGGVLTYGIPEFRLPKKIVELEIDYIKSLGVEIKTDMLIGNVYSIEELLKKYKAIFIGSGAGLPKFMKIPGENLDGVYSANEYLFRVNMMKAWKFPEYLTPIKIGKKVAVVGGGNVAMDAARVSLRLGAEEVYIVYRRSQEQMPARKEEIHRAVEEGIIFKNLTLPIAYYADENGWVKEVECIQMELFEPDSSGRRRPVPIKESNFKISVETVIVAIGNSPNPLIPYRTPDLKTESWGGVVITEEGATSILGVFAGGDIVRGAATVISAMGDGKRAAKAIHKKLSFGEGII
ncbi:glutamate synthase (NADPH), homotetrameric [candidate division WOR-1 bacterium RIFOXYD2_FULL_36_8]|uniref:Glutamate synthase (NADPH), homotetrameric n=1 Tax=candidate division WOR-1 bacterium RIFOXYB2_FULL_36_35 TaxID=1802578 RepID=A0A1F4RX64_UNCSA|nr:MAG: glutamate synthase (NADPH), homotetrameric [candidate division WOR-1 bacterium RIFOXYA2_FULL_36_21]OGC12761.1 MAG: glutamate synthase (NADPH), homotetrameric [candidate division WOR-1 bacterium RIFOXYB2_FULL_36_35]OGC19796.1 MAG: glutamate synthase (NADPH), homotetrameric [candidate division WOR-1 bacterium RIFOXYA12_FULL_36_13]OGC38732.1 MAG: glutamate synthase (NADPH), homotetrameric [candidate division WOR-1 bacterium RIFOXYD2_FULL_36_8]